CDTRGKEEPNLKVLDSLCVILELQRCCAGGGRIDAKGQFTARKTSRRSSRYKRVCAVSACLGSLSKFHGCTAASLSSFFSSMSYRQSLESRFKLFLQCLYRSIRPLACSRPS